jgi:hypothetical protein
VDEIRGAGAVGEGRRERFDVAGADGIFEVGAPSGLIGGAVREYAVDESTALTSEALTSEPVVGPLIHEGRGGAFGDTSVYRPWASTNRSWTGIRTNANTIMSRIAAHAITSERIITLSLTCINGKISPDKKEEHAQDPSLSTSQDIPS